ncbi:MAG: hypothetical protein ACPG77_12455, partial [Nannocystaceae bacterium]
MLAASTGQSCQGIADLGEIGSNARTVGAMRTYNGGVLIQAAGGELWSYGVEVRVHREDIAEFRSYAYPLTAE